MNQYSDNDYAFAYDKALKRYMSDIHNLFSQERGLQDCCKEYRQNEEKYSIEGFNLFQVIAEGRNNNFDYENEHLHSNMLKFLLHPKEKHGQGGKFLRKFITFLKNEHSCSTINLDHYQHAEVIREEVIQKKNHIDVLIKGNKHAIIIENKVSRKAGNQKNQIYRYYDEVKKKHNVDAILYLTRNSSHPVNLEGLPVTGSSPEKRKYNKIKKDIENRKIFKNILYYADANEEKKNKSLYHGFFEPCPEELQASAHGAEKHGELVIMLQHYLGAVKTFGGEEMNEGIMEHFFRTLQEMSESDAAGESPQHPDRLITEAKKLLDETRNYYHQKVCDAVKEKWGNKSEDNENYLYRKMIGKKRIWLNYQYNEKDEWIWYGFEPEEEEGSMKGMTNKLDSILKKGQLRKYHGESECEDEYVGYYLDIFKIPELPDNIDKAADRIVKALEYLEEAYKKEFS